MAEALHNRFTSWALGALACAAFLSVSAFAEAESRKVVVAKFDGPEKSSKLMRKAVLEIVGDVYEVLPYRKYRVASRRLGIEPDSVKAYRKIATRVGADAIVEGSIRKRKLTLRVREGRSGRVIDKFNVKVGSRGASERTREVLTDELVDLIDSTEPVSAGISALDGGGAEPSTVADTRASLIPTVDGPEPDTWIDDDKTSEKPSKPSAIQLQAAVGIAGSARQLRFAFQGSLSEEERPQELSGSPSPGLAVLAIADVAALGISTEFRWERSIGAKVAFRDGGITKQAEVAMGHLGIRALVRRQVRNRISLQVGAGYQQSSYTMRNRPSGLLIPDARYSFLEAGVGLRAKLRDDRLVVSAEGAYLHNIASGGITDRKLYGSAAIQGMRGEIGLEIEATETTYVRISGRYALIRLLFTGDGDLINNLDDNDDRDVSGAQDRFIGGNAMVGFRF